MAIRTMRNPLGGPGVTTLSLMTTLMIYSMSLTASTTLAQTTWTGAASSDWTDTANWSTGVPTGASDAVIPGGTPNDPSTAGAATATCDTLVLQAGATLTIAAGFPLAADNGATVDGTIVGGDVLRLIGNGNVVASTPLPDMVVDTVNALNIVTFDTATVNGDLTVVQGRFRVDSNATVTVNGDVLGQGGAIDAGSTNTSFLDVGGDVTLNGSAVTSVFVPRIQLDGNWSSDAAFNPTGNRVVFSGPAPQTLTAVTMNTIEVPAGNDVSTVSNLDLSDDLIVDGTFSTTGDIVISDDYTVTGNSSLLGEINIDGNVNVSGTADFGTHDPTFRQGFICSGTCTSTANVFVFDGNGTGIVTVSAPLPNVRIDKTNVNNIVTFDTATVNGDLTVVQGRFRVDSNATVTVNGDVLGQGGVIDAGSTNTSFLDVGGNVTLNGSAVTSVFVPRIQLDGNWSSDAAFNPTGNRIVFSGPAPQTLTAVTMNTIEVPAGNDVSTVSNLDLSDDLIVDGTFSTTGDIVISDDYTVTGNSSLLGEINIDGNVNVSGTADFGTHDPTFRQGFICSGTCTSTANVFVFDGNGTGIVTVSAPLPNVRIDKTNVNNIVTFDTATVNGDLTVVQGRFRVDSNATVTVNGDVLGQGGVIDAGSTNTSFLDVGGNVTLNGSAVTSVFVPRIQLDGNWSSDAAFNPTGNRIVFSGPAPQTLTAVTMNTIEVPAGNDVSTVSNLDLSDDLIVDGTFSTTGDIVISDDYTVTGNSSLLGEINIDGNVNVSGTADFGTHDPTFRQGFICSGTCTSTANVFVFDGNGTGIVTVSAPLPNVRIDKTNVNNIVTFDTATVNGDLTVVQGRFRVDSNATVTVNGDFFGQGGVIDAGSTTTSILDANGDVTFSGIATGFFLPRLLVAGDWSADTGFAPPNNGHTVEFDGTTPSSIASNTSGGTITFRNLVIRNGRRMAGQDVVIDAQNITIDAGGELATSNRRLVIPAAPVVVNGTLAVNAGGELALGTTTDVDINSGGTLSVIGAFANRARVTGDSGGGYALNVNVGATIAGQNYEFNGMGPAGIVVAQGATIAPRPFDLRAGRFDLPSSTPNSVLLDIQRPGPTDLRYVEFENTNGTGTFNVQTLGGAPIRVVNFSGGFADAPFENDPMDLITWVPTENTQLGSFVVTGGPECVIVTFTTLDEPDVAEFIIESSLSASGPFAPVAVLSAVGSSRYEFIDAPLIANQTVHYRLIERLDFGLENVLANDSATPFSAADPANLYRVGPNGAFADIAAALAAATEAQSIVVVEPGTYPSFTVDTTSPMNIRIVGDGTGVVAIDTTTGPLVIRDKIEGESVELLGLEIGDPTSSNAGLFIENTDATVLVDRGTIISGSGQLGVEIINSRNVALQKTDITGGLELSMDAACIASKGNVDDVTILDTSRMETAEFTATNVTADPTATVTNLAGVMPDVDVPDLIGLHDDITVAIDGPAGSLWALGVTTQLAWFDYAVPFLELVSLIGPMDQSMIFRAGLTDGSGTTQFTVGVPVDQTIIGLNFVLQLLMFDPQTGSYRFGNAETVLIVP